MKDKTIELDFDVSTQRRKVLLRTYVVGAFAFLGAYLLNPGEPGVSAQYNAISFPVMIGLNIISWFFTWREKELRGSHVWVFLTIYGLYFATSFVFLFFVFPPNQDIHTQAVPLMAYISMFLLPVYLLLELKYAQIFAGIYNGIFLVLLLLYSFSSGNDALPSQVVQAYYQQICVVNMIIMVLFMATPKIRQIHQRAMSSTANIEKIAFTDELTGLDNRHFLTQLLTQEFNRFKEDLKNAYVIVIVDIDHFKRVNDEHGHNVGDRVLTLVASTLKKSVRNTDWVGRWGGEEFIMLLGYMPTEFDMKIIVERICRSVAGAREEGCPPVTASFGMASVRPTDQTVGDAIGRADEALYRAKNGGRNRVEQTA